jgi:hypothetical protein
VLGGATGTWAFVHHLRSRAVKPSAPPEKVQPAVSERVVEPVRRRHRHQPSSLQEKVVEPARKPRVKHAKTEAQPAAPTPEHAPITPGEVIIVPSRVSGDDHVIVVSPPAKLGPLWTPDTYKKRGVR